MDRIIEILWDFAEWFSGVPKRQLKCGHPLYARDSRLQLLVGEQEGWDAYEECLNCGREFHDKEVK